MPLHLFHDPEHAAHHGPLDHPERPERVGAILQHLGDTGRLARYAVTVPDDLPAGQREASIAQLACLHDRAYLDAFADACVAQRPYFQTPDCPLTGDTARIARRATALALEAGRRLRGDRAFRGFVAIRPPGHHAERARAMGFCFHNHAAIVADALLRPSDDGRPGLCRVAVVDFDVHHGNGTQHLLEQRADALFISLHEDPVHQYPGTGYAHEAGTGAGEGFTLNVSLEPGSGDDDFLAALAAQVLPKLADFAPEALIFSAGFDAHADDPIGHLQLTTPTYGELTRRVLTALPNAGRATPVLSLLEGGYDLNALASSVAAHLDALESH